MRHVAKRSKELYPADKRFQLSHTYVRKMEEGSYEAPSPFRMRTLARIYEVSYEDLLNRAGYLDSNLNAKPGYDRTAANLEDHLKKNGIKPEYFIQALLSLGKESLSLVNRTVTVLSVQGNNLRKKVERNQAQ